ncbi:MAG: alpha-2-macroglobulin family protein, partial [Paralcaligenes sp.]
TPDGKPAANGQVAFAAVDQALLELSPNKSWDLLNAMRQLRSYGVETSTAQMQIVGRRHYGRKALPAGGGGGKSPTRELLDTLLLWLPNVPLDQNGRAQITVPLNDSITQFKLVAVADDGVQRFGTGSTSVATTQDLQLISGLPALIRSEDRYQAMVTVRNTTSRTMKVEVGASVSAAALSGQSLAAQTLQIAAGAARVASWTVQAPNSQSEGSSTLKWTLQARELADAGVVAAPASDRLSINQILMPSVPVTAMQATLLPIDARQPLTRLPVAVPKGALTGPDGYARGGLDITLQSSLAGGLPGVKQWFLNYPYTCLEQLSSVALGVRSVKRWQALMQGLPNYLDNDGLLMYFPGMRHGSEVLTAYVLAASNEAQALGLPFALPPTVQESMQRGLLAFVQGKIVRRYWSPQEDLDVRKLLALEALSRVGQVNARLLDSIVIKPNSWPTSAVIDWLSLLQRVPSIPDRAARLAQATQILQARMVARGTEIVFPNDAQNNWWWLMTGPDVNMARLILTTMGQPSWNEDMPRMVQGLLHAQVRGAWRTTTANLMGSLALEKFAQHYEITPVSGQTVLRLESKKQGQTVDWSAIPEKAGIRSENVFYRWRSPADSLLIEQNGAGQGWATVRSMAAVPLTKPLMAGYSVTRTVTPVYQAVPGVWSRGDVYRVKLDIVAEAATTWAVLTDPVPGGATILGSGLGRDSSISAAAANPSADDNVWPSFVERSFDSYRAYYEYLPRGASSVQYTVRLNTIGQFNLPPTRIEAMYQPDVFGVAPNSAGVAVQAGKQPQ